MLEEDRRWQFKTTVSVPSKLVNRKVILHIKTGVETGWDLANPQLLVYVNGSLIQGLDIRHRDIILTERAGHGESFEIRLEGYCGINGGFSELEAAVSGLDENTEGLYYDIKAPLETAELLDANDKRRIDIINFLCKAINLLDLRDVYSDAYTESVGAARDYLNKSFYSDYCDGENSRVSVSLIGHTHIDTAWLWPLSQTREKVVRSFSTVLNLMKQYPEYLFMSSQPQLYEFFKEQRPDIYEQIKERVREGRWEPDGGMWIESDCNIISGESLIRQLMFGKKFFKDEFGVDSQIAWLPDTFGFSGALPQILKKCGMKYFLTSKLGWNEYHEMPFDSFVWRGIDGSEILAHFITAQSPTFMPTPHAVSYNGRIDAPHLTSSWNKYRQKKLHSEVIMAFGYGDGGGGPTKEMLEAAKRFKKGIPGCPRVKMQKAGDFFKKLDERRSDVKFPTWAGELYMEGCRGALTSMGRVKKDNRKAEFLYQDAELWCVLAKLLLSAPYPGDAINRGWKTILLNQFHDIVTGVSIKEVYEDHDRDFLKVNAIGREALETALKLLAGNINTKEDSLTVFNQLSHSRSDIVFAKLPDGWVNADVFDGAESLPSQICEDGRIAFVARNVPGNGFKTFGITETGPKDSISDLHISAERLENRFFIIKLDENAEIVSLFDKRAEREILPEGTRGNVLQAFEDKPYHYDAWEISLYYEDKMWEPHGVETVDIPEQGEVYGKLRVTRKFSKSRIVQYITIYKDIPRVDFITTVDWREKQVLLKAAFPVDIRADKASYEIQYGAIERPTHRNTPWDAARFEVSNQKWADLSEAGYGVSLLNDCKYGIDIHDGLMRLSLLKSPIDPYPGADNEIHSFTYSLYPHEGGWREGGTSEAAYNLNRPMTAVFTPVQGGGLNGNFSFASSGSRNVLIDTVKLAENGEGIILRIFESEGRRTNASVKLFKEAGSVWECDMLENKLEELKANKDVLEFEIKPFEIKTFRLFI